MNSSPAAPAPAEESRVASATTSASTTASQAAEEASDAAKSNFSSRLKSAIHNAPQDAAPRASHEQAMTPSQVAEPGASVALPQPFSIALRNSLAFALSALLSPYLVIPVGTFVIVASQPSKSRAQFLLWTALSILFSTVIPALYVVIQIARGKITDVHVMEREQRGGPFLVAVVSSAIGAFILYRMKAPPTVWGIGVVLLFNGVVLSWITSFWKISMHVAVLSATVMAAIIMVPGVQWWSLVWMIPALMWARATRGRHSLWQGIAGCTVSCGITGAVFYLVPRLWPLLQRTIERLT